jgi:hypothetical protein
VSGGFGRGSGQSGAERTVYIDEHDKPEWGEDPAVKEVAAAAIEGLSRSGGEGSPEDGFLKDLGAPAGTDDAAGVDQGRDSRIGGTGDGFSVFDGANDGKPKVLPGLLAGPVPPVVCEVHNVRGTLVD